MKKDGKTKKVNSFLSLLLALALAFSLISATAFADDEPQDQTTDSGTTETSQDDEEQTFTLTLTDGENTLTDISDVMITLTEKTDSEDVDADADDDSEEDADEDEDTGDDADSGEDADGSADTDGDEESESAQEYTAEVSQGVASFTGLDSSVTYIAVLGEIEGYSVEESYEIIFDEDGAASITLEAKETLTVSGTVKDEDGTAVEGVKVNLANTSQNSLEYTESDSSGAFSFTIYSEDKDSCYIYASDYSSEVYKTDSASDSDSIYLSSASDVSNIEVVLYFNEYTVSVSCEDEEGGSVYIGDDEECTSTTVKYGKSVVITMVPDDSYDVSSVTVNDTDVTESLSYDEESGSYTYTCTNVTQDQAVSVEFYRSSYTVTLSIGENGSVTYEIDDEEYKAEDSAQVTVSSGGSLTLTLTPEMGYYVSSVKFDDGDSDSTETTYEQSASAKTVVLEEVDSDVTITVTFSIATCTVSVEQSGGTGTVTLNDEEKTVGTYEYGTEVIIGITPPENYNIESVVYYVGESTDGVNANLIYIGTTDSPYSFKIYLEIDDDGYNYITAGYDDVKVIVTYSEITSITTLDSSDSVNIPEPNAKSDDGSIYYYTSAAEISIAEDASCYFFVNANIAIVYTVSESTDGTLTIPLFEYNKWYTYDTGIQFIIDGDAPVFSDVTGTDSGWGSSATVTGVVTDEGSGVASVYYEYTDEDGNTQKVDVETDEDGNFTITFDEEGQTTYTLYAVDNATNVSSGITINASVDTTAPEISITAGGDGSWTNSDVTVTGVVTDSGSGIASLYYTYEDDNGGIVTVDATSSLTYEDDSKTSATFSITFSEEQSETYKLYATDLVENTTDDDDAPEFDINIDKTSPVFDETSLSLADGTEYTGGWTNQAVTISAQISDEASGIASVYYTYEDDNGETATVDITSYLETDEETGEVSFEYTFSDEQDEEYTFYIVDTAQNTRVGYTVTVKIDTTNPSADAVSVSIDENSSVQAVLNKLSFGIFFNSEVSITITASDSGDIASGAASVSLYEYDEDGSYTLIETVQVSDSTAVFSISKTEYYEASLAVVVTDGAGNSTEYISLADIGSEDDIESSDFMYETDAPEVEIETGDAVYTVDTDDDGTADENWYNSDVTFKVTASDVLSDDDDSDSYSGIAEVSITVNGAEADTSEADFSSSRVKEYSLEISTADFTANADGSYVISVTVTDNAGNESETYTQTVYVDKDAPEITISYDNNDVENSKYFDASRTATITVTDRNFTSENISVTITADTDGDTPQLGSWSCTKESSEDDYTETWQATVTFEDDGDYELSVSGSDALGNETQAASYAEGTEAGSEFTIDTVNPVITVSYDNNTAVNEKYFASSRVATITIEEHNFDADLVTITVTSSSGNAPSASSWSSDGDIHTATITYSGDAAYTFAISMTDLAGNGNSSVSYGSSVAPTSFTVDKTAPTGTLTATSAEGDSESWSSLVSSLTYGFYSKSKITVSASTKDATSGVYSVQYYKVSSSNATDNTTALTTSDLEAVTSWKDFSTLTIKDEEQFVIYLKITDYAGNYRYISTNGLIVDETAPKETLSPEVSASSGQPLNGIYSDDVTVDITVKDPVSGGTYSGISTITYEVTNMGEVTQSGTLYSFSVSDPAQSKLKQQWSGSITVDAEKNNSNNVKVIIYATDNAGNTSSKTISLKIDVTDPEISVSYNNNSAENEKYFSASRTATITITERNFDADDVVITVTKDGSSYSVGNLKWTKKSGSGNGDSTTYTAKITYSDDGEYTFDIDYTDLAGNSASSADYGSSVAPKNFVIDKTNPTISVSYNNNSASNGTYFNASRTMTITIVEHNFDVSLVTITQTASLDGGSATVPSVSWSSSGDTHTATIVYSSDGDYTFDISMTDLAGNANSTVNYGSSVAAQAFTIDTTGATITVSGVENGKSYRDDVVPVISFSEINYSGDGPTIKLYRTRKDEIDVDVTEEFIEGELTEGGKSGTISINTFTKIKDNDGIYRLVVTYTDLAGNVTEKEINFTVNRFGSVYVYSEDLIDLIDDGGAYVQTVQGDELIITEYNPDKLVEGSLNIQITKDGQSVSDADVTVSPVINDEVETGESGWYQYEYVIDTSNFEEDGVYKITVSTQDEAGNSPENSNSDYDEILFRVDTTAPEITSVTGLEEKVVNATELEIDYTVYDTIGLESIEVIVDGETAAEISSDELSDDINNYSGSFTITEKSYAQSVEIIVTDKAGNVTDTADASFAPSAYTYNRSITVSSNFFVRWYANKPLFWGTIIAFIVIVGFIFFIILFKRRKDEEEEEEGAKA